MSSDLVERLRGAANVQLVTRAEVRALLGEGELGGVVIEDLDSGERRTMDARALFVFIGASANTGWLRGAVELDEDGFVVTGDALGGARGWLETSVPGVFAAGDVRCGSVKRVASAVGEGSMSVTFVHTRLARLGRGAGRP